MKNSLIGQHSSAASVKFQNLRGHGLEFGPVFQADRSDFIVETFPHQNDNPIPIYNNNVINSHRAHMYKFGPQVRPRCNP